MWLRPTRLSFHASQLPFPQGYLGRKSPEHDRHLQDHENAEYAQNHAQERKEKRGRLAGEDKSNRSDKIFVAFRHLVTVQFNIRLELKDLTLG